MATPLYVAMYSFADYPNDYTYIALTEEEYRWLSNHDPLPVVSDGANASPLQQTLIQSRNDALAARAMPKSLYDAVSDDDEFLGDLHTFFGIEPSAFATYDEAKYISPTKDTMEGFHQFFVSGHEYDCVGGKLAGGITGIVEIRANSQHDFLDFLAVNDFQVAGSLEEIIEFR